MAGSGCRRTAEGAPPSEAHLSHQAGSLPLLTGRPSPNVRPCHPSQSFRLHARTGDNVDRACLFVTESVNVAALIESPQAPFTPPVAMAPRAIIRARVIRHVQINCRTATTVLFQECPLGDLA